MRKIENRLFNEGSGKQLVILTEIDGKYYISGEGRLTETTIPPNNSDKLIVNLKSYLNDEVQPSTQ